MLSGTPSAAGTFTVAVTARDATSAANGGPFVSAAKSISLTVATPTVAVTTSTLPASTFGAAYASTTLAASGGIGPYSFTATGLPAGLTLSPAGVLTGTPSAAGNFTVVVTARDATTAANGGPFVSPARALTLSVNQAASAIALASSANPSTFGQSVSLTADISPAVASGTVTFQGAGIGIGTATISNGKATLTTSTLTVGSHVLTAVYTGDANLAGSTSSALSQVVIGQPAMTIAVSTAPASFSAAGTTIGYSFVVTNTGNVAVSGIAVTDTRATGLTCPATALAAGARMTCTGSYVTIAADVVAATAILDTARVTGTPASGTLSAATANGSVAFVGQPSWTLSATANPSVFSMAGQTIAYSYSLINTGNVAISGIALSGTKVSAPACPASTLAAGGRMTCTGSYVSVAADVSAGTIASTVTAAGTPAAGQLASATAQTSVTYRAPASMLTVSVTSPPGRDGTFSFTSTIPGAASFTIATSGGSGSRSFTAMPAATYTLTETAGPAGLKLTAVACGGTTQAGGAARVTIPAGGNVACVFQHAVDQAAIAQKTETNIRNFMGTRAKLLTSTGPDRSRLNSRLQGSIFGNDNEDAGGSAPMSTSGFASVPDGGIDAQSGLGIGQGLRGSSMPSAFGAPRGGDGQMMLRGSTFGADLETSRPGSPPASIAGNIDDGQGRVSFRTSYGQLLQASQDQDASKARLAGNSNGPAATQNRGGMRPSKFDVWTEVQTGFSETGRPGSQTSSRSSVAYVGADYLVHPGILIGTLVALDWLQERNSSSSTLNDGQGWMVGPYMSARLTKNLFFDTHAAWGQSTNKSNIEGDIARFQTTRSLLQARLTGNWRMDRWNFTPSVDVTYFREVAPVTFIAPGVSVAEQSVALGKVTFGPQASYVFKNRDGDVFEPLVGLKGMWNFIRDDSTTTSATAGGDVFGLKGEVGAILRLNSGISMRAAGSYEGFGIGTTKAYQGQAVVRIPLN